MLSKRLLTAAVLIPPVLGLVIWGGMPYFLFIWAAMAIGAAEFVGIAFGAADRFSRAVAWLAIMIVGSATMYLSVFSAAVAPLLLAVFLLVFIAHLFRPADLEGATRRLAFSVMGMVYLGLTYPFVYQIRALPAVNGGRGWGWVLLLFGVVWLGDTGAYFAGRFLGKRKLYPLISPGKTWAGACGGLCAGFI
ncbi:MAG: phosphatidate cytidylyltransferase, partial [Pseudomonadota bacterium]